MASNTQFRRFLTGSKLIILTLLMFALTLSACSGDQNADEETTEDTTVVNNDPYMMMHDSFVGNPERVEIKGLLEDVLTKYKLPQTDSTRLVVGNMLLMLRQTSKTNVTEMAILKDIYQHGATDISLDKQAILSATELEQVTN